MPVKDKKVKRFQVISILAVVVVFLLILVGGIVRTTGAGMGCPDWPTCFGQWVPPTDESQLPANYQEIYASHGYSSMAFNAVKTWTEYVNRLFGVTTGLFVIAAFVASFAFRKMDKVIPFLAGLNLLLVIFQGWLGAKVVDSNLAEYMITIHLVLALFIAGLMIFFISRSFWNFKSFDADRLIKTNKLLVPVILATVISLAQIIIGTFVRGEVNSAVSEVGYSAKAVWLSHATQYFPLHKSFAMIVLAVNVLLIARIVKEFSAVNYMKYSAAAIAGVLLMQFITGWSLSFFDFPAAAQALHILFGSLLFGVQIFLVSIIINENWLASKQAILKLQYS